MSNYSLSVEPALKGELQTKYTLPSYQRALQNAKEQCKIPESRDLLGFCCRASMVYNIMLLILIVTSESSSSDFNKTVFQRC